MRRADVVPDSIRDASLRSVEDLKRLQHVLLESKGERSVSFELYTWFKREWDGV
jgi:hypothetical protein